jgi:hypothetical protein
MAHEQVHGETHLFTLRLWREDLGAEQSEWRGKIVHVRSGETRYVRDWATLLAFIQARLGGPQGDADRGESAGGARAASLHLDAGRAAPTGARGPLDCDDAGRDADGGT